MRLISKIVTAGAILALPIYLPQALAQSTGGLIEKRGKLILVGEEGETNQSNSASAARSDEPDERRGTGSRKRRRGHEGGGGGSSCGRITGRWTWFTGDKVMIAPGGSFRAVSGMTGTWSCSGSMAVLHWNALGNGIDRLHISGDGKHLNGSNQYGIPISGSRY